jgi:two-component system chemotaxis response regulator CheB
MRSASGARAEQAAARRLRVLIVDDSASIRMVLSDIIAAEPDMEVMATAGDPYVAVERMRQSVPDVMVLDIELPRMDGLTFLRKIMAQRPIPVVICSSLTQQGSDKMIQAFSAGAVEVIAKPRVETAQALQESRMLVCDAIRAAAHARSVRFGRPQPPAIPPQAKLTADPVVAPLPAHRLAKLRETLPVTEPVLCIGASTGGTEALRDVLEAMPPDAPGIVIVQHMPHAFTAAFAHRLNGLCRIEVREAANGDRVVPGLALIAPGGHHMVLRRINQSYRVDVVEGPYVSRHRPSVDVLFRSAAYAAGANAVGVIMTGMGDDGATGMSEMREMGAGTIAQDQATSVVFGMPKEAIERGCVERVVPLGRIATEALRMARATHGATRAR